MEDVLEFVKYFFFFLKTGNFGMKKKLDQQIQALAKSDNLSLIPRTHRVEGDNLLLQDVL